MHSICRQATAVHALSGRIQYQGSPLFGFSMGQFYLHITTSLALFLICVAVALFEHTEQVSSNVHGRALSVMRARREPSLTAMSCGGSSISAYPDGAPAAYRSKCGRQCVHSHQPSLGKAFRLLICRYSGGWLSAETLPFICLQSQLLRIGSEGHISEDRSMTAIAMRFVTQSVT